MNHLALDFAPHQLLNTPLQCTITPLKYHHSSPLTAAQRYNITATKHYSNLHHMTIANNISENRQIVAGPMGFGNAVQLNTSLMQVGYGENSSRSSSSSIIVT